jgi:DNA end-binding protein Ku
MAQRPIWRGQLRLALVSCPVALYSTKHDRGTIRFHLINPATGNRIRMVTQDAETEREVARADLVKGYEFKKDTYVLLTDEDFASVRVDSSSVITIDKFVDAASIDPIYYDSSYYLVPDGEAGRDVYAVLLQAFEKSKRVGLSRVVIAQRERTIVLRTAADGLVAQTLYEERDINDAKPLFGDMAEMRTDPSMVDLARQLIERQAARYSPSDLEDRYETRLRALIDAKVKGADIEDEAPVEPERTNVVDLMAALKESLGQSAGKPGSRSAPKKPAAKKSASRHASQSSRSAARKRA